jgi:hypothetical protein
VSTAMGGLARTRRIFWAGPTVPRGVMSRLTAGEGYPFQTYFPQGQGIDSVGCFFSRGFRQTGQFFCHIGFT